MSARKPRYYRDVWILGPPSNGYPGAFPRGLINHIRRKWWGARRLWVCSGSHQDSGGTTIDLNPETRPRVVGDAQQLPFLDESFDFVMADPPYSVEEAARLYDLPYPSPMKLLNEMWRVCETGGHILFLHRLIPMDPQLPWTMRHHFEAVVGVGITGAWSNIRALSVWKKPHQLELWS